MQNRQSYCPPPEKVTHNSHSDWVKKSELVDKAKAHAEAADQAVQKALDEQTAANELLNNREEEMDNARAAGRARTSRLGTTSSSRTQKLRSTFSNYGSWQAILRGAHREPGKGTRQAGYR